MPVSHRWFTLRWSLISQPHCISCQTGTRRGTADPPPYTPAASDVWLAIHGKTCSFVTVALRCLLGARGAVAHL